MKRIYSLFGCFFFSHFKSLTNTNAEKLQFFSVFFLLYIFQFLFFLKEKKQNARNSLFLSFRRFIKKTNEPMSAKIYDKFFCLFFFNEWIFLFNRQGTLFSQHRFSIQCILKIYSTKVVVFNEKKFINIFLIMFFFNTFSSVSINNCTEGFFVLSLRKFSNKIKVKKRSKNRTKNEISF